MTKTMKVKKNPLVSGPVVIDRQATSGDNRHFTVKGNLEMEGVTLKGSYSDGGGGAVYVRSSTGKAADAEASVDKLFSTYSSTPYAIFAAFEMAKYNVNNGDVKNAKPYLKWVIGHGKLEGQIDIARLRLGQLLLGQGDTEEALVVAKQAETIAFKSLFSELKGDIYTAQNQLSEAANAYRTALSLLDKSEPRSLVLKLKLDDVAGS